MSAYITCVRVYHMAKTQGYGARRLGNGWEETNDCERIIYNNKGH